MTPTKIYEEKAVTVRPTRRIAGVVISAPNEGDPITVDARFALVESIDSKVISAKDVNLTRNAAQLAAVPAVNNAINVILEYLDAQQDAVEAAAKSK